MTESFQLMLIRTGYTEEGSHLPAVFRVEDTHLVGQLLDYRPTDFPPSHFDVPLEIPAIKIADVAVLQWITEEGIVSRYHYWIKSMEAVSISRKVTRINVTPAYWLDYAYKADVSPARIEGKLKRSPVLADSIETSMMPRTWTMEDFQPLGKAQTDPYYGVILSATTPDGGVQTYYWKAKWTDGTSCTITVAGTSGYYYSPSLRDVFAGKLTELFGSIMTIKNVSLIPFVPMMVTDNITVPSETVKNELVVTNGNYFMFRFNHGYSDSASSFYIPPSDFQFQPYEDGNYVLPSLNSEYSSDDCNKAAVLDPFGQIIARLPSFRNESGHEKINSCYGYVDNAASNPLIRVYFLTDDDWNSMFDEWFALRRTIPPADILQRLTVEGKTVDIPALPLPLTSSAFSEYLLSGEREYQQKMRENQALQGLGNVATGAVSGALIGAMAGGVGAIPGALIGAGSGLAGIGLNYYGSVMAQEATETKVKNQPSQVIQTGGGSEMILNGGRFWVICTMRWDAVSLAEYTGEVTRRGYECDRSVNDRALIPGGWQFENPMILNSDISTEVKRAMMAILERGIHLD